MERYLAIDCGKAETKIAIRNNNDSSVLTKSFPTHVIKKQYTDIDTAFNMGNSFQVEFSDSSYIVGQMATGEESTTSISSSKRDLKHKIATLTAIASNVNNGDSVKVAICCPIEEYQNKPRRQEYLDFIIPKGRIDIKINNVDKNFTITDAIVFPESLGAMNFLPTNLAQSLVGVIDIDGLNVNACLINKGLIETTRCFTGKLGRKFINASVKENLEAKYPAEFSDFEIDSFIENGYVPNHKEESSKIIETVLDNHMHKVVDLCKTKNWNIDFMTLMFIGGTSLLLADRIRNKFPEAVLVENANYVNAIGALKALCSKHKVMTSK